MSLYLALNLRRACLPLASKADHMLNVLKYSVVQRKSESLMYRQPGRKWSSIARAALVTLSHLVFHVSPDQREAVQTELISLSGVLLLSNLLCPQIASMAKAASSKPCAP